MTVFVVSLFLPHTINFQLPSGSSVSQQSYRRQSVARKNTVTKKNTSRANAPPLVSKPSLFGNKDITPPESPTADRPESAVEFFTNPRDVLKDLRVHIPKQDNLAPSDPHSPAWGTGRLLTQPQSRASSPPPADILHRKTDDKAVALGRAGIRQPLLGNRSESHDRVFAEAEWQVVAADQGNGGLRNAVRAAERAGALEDKIWVGTLGMPTDALLGTQQRHDIEERLANEYDSLTVFCKDSDFDGHYTHYCKQILWPVFHYQIPDNPKSKAYEDHSWCYYVAVCQAFADVIVKNWKRGDTIWIHDYHLLLVPQMVRKKLPDAKIGFFLHVAFPSSEIFRCLAMRKELLEGMLGANLVGFQIPEYARHCLQTCSRILSVEATNDGLQLEDRFVNVVSQAIGIDPTALDNNRLDNEVTEWLEIMQERYRGKKLIVARDKLDAVRGVRQKLLAYELFLNQNPEWRDKVVLIQVALSTTEQPDLDATVSDIVTRINSSWANLAYQPLVYLKQDISYAQYLALLTVADALMITSQREGMNLTCHEYLFCQDGKFPGHNKFGSLILSEFTGSTSVFGGNELSVNPWDYRQCANAIKTALTMEDAEKQRRWNALYAAVMHHTAEYWHTSFLTHLDQVYETQNSRHSLSIPRLSINMLGKDYLQSTQRLFLLDYEGTLASWGSPTNNIHISPQRTIDALNDLLHDARNIVYVMSSRQPEELEALFKRVPGLGLIAENGCFVREFGNTKWTKMTNEEDMAWKDPVEKIFQYYQERTPGSKIDKRYCSLSFNYKNSEDVLTAARQAGDVASHVNESCSDQRVKAYPVDGAVIVEPIDYTKATASEYILKHLRDQIPPDSAASSPIDFLLIAGDGREDEPVFEWANSLKEQGTVKKVSTVSLGSRNTSAMFTLTQGVTGVLTALQRLSQLSSTSSSAQVPRSSTW